MKKNEISEIIGNIDDKYIDEALFYAGETKTDRHKGLMKFGTLAACLAVILIGGSVILPSVQSNDFKIITSENSTDPRSTNDNTDSSLHEKHTVSDSTEDSSDSVMPENSTGSNSTDDSSVSYTYEGSAAPVETENNANIIPFGELDRPYRDVSISASESARIWEWEYLTPYEQYTSMDLNGKEFISRMGEISETLLGDTIGSYEVYGYDTYTEQAYYQTFEVKRIQGVDDDLMAAVNINGTYYVFKNDEYSPPSTFGELMDSYDLTNTIELHRFTTYEGYTDTGYYALENDDMIWQILSDCRNTAFIEADFWDHDDENSVSFSVTSEALGVYKNALSISDNGYLRTNIFDWGYIYYIGEEAANKIISYAAENAAGASYEPYTNMIAGTLIGIYDGYFLVDDSILCDNADDGMVFKVSTDDLRISRYVDSGEIKVGDLIKIDFTGDIDIGDGNRVTEIYSISLATIYDGYISVEE